MLIVNTHLGIIHFWLSLTFKKEEGEKAISPMSVKTEDSPREQHHTIQNRAWFKKRLEYVSTYSLKETHNKNKSNMTSH